MAEQTDILTNPVLQKKIDGYRVDNFAVPQELTVTVTLSEYRELVTNKAVCDSKVSEATSARWKVETERDKLKTTLAEVRDSLDRVHNDLAVANNLIAELQQGNEKLTQDLVKTRNERDDAVSQLEKRMRNQPKPSDKKSKK